MVALTDVFRTIPRLLVENMFQRVLTCSVKLSLLFVDSFICFLHHSLSAEAIYDWLSMIYVKLAALCNSQSHFAILYGDIWKAHSLSFGSVLGCWMEFRGYDENDPHIFHPNKNTNQKVGP